MSIEKLLQEQVKKTAFEGDTSRPNLGKLYAILMNILSIFVGDTRAVFRGFFPGLGTRAFMDAHAKALALPRVADESDESLRLRLMVASQTMKRSPTP